MASKVVSLNSLGKLRKTLHEQHKRIVFTTGSFDLLHVGQLRYLAEARAMGDVLIVGIASDESRLKQRKNRKPILKETLRSKTLTYFRPVDFVCVVDELDLREALKKLQPDIFYTVADDWKNKVRRREEVRLIKSYGGRIVKIEKDEPYMSSSMMVEKIADAKVKEIAQRSFSDLGLQVGDGPSGNFLKKPLDFGSTPPRTLLALPFKGEVVPRRSLKMFGEKLRKEGKKITFTAGSFDLVHLGHVTYFEKANPLGDVLIVGVQSDAALRKLKGYGRPFVVQESRAALLYYLRSVDYATIFPEDTILETLKILQPNVMFTIKEEWNAGYRKSREYRLVRGYGGRVVCVPSQAPYVSASQIIMKAAGRRVKEIFKDCLSEVEKVFEEEV